MSTAAGAPRLGWPLRAALAVAGVFLLAALPFAFWQVTSNSDEARYTVAAARMMATGDYIIPYAAWGEVRLLKPPLTYYYVVAGFALFGQSVFGAKSMWLLSALAILALTWALARAVGAGRAGAAVAVTALGSNLLFFRGALTHNPDIPLVLGSTAALVGFARLLADDRPPPWAFWAAWLGIAWAVMAKGLLALVLAALAVTLRTLRRGVRRPGRAEIAAVAVALVAVGWWYVLVALREPAMLVEQFFGDQVTEKVAGDGILRGLGYFAGFLALSFLPILLVALPPRFRGWRRPRPEVLLLAIWTALMVVIFSFSNYQVARYLLPGLPAAAALIGLALDRLDPTTLARRAGLAVRLLLLPAFAVLVFSVAIVQAGSTILAAALGLVAGVAILGGLWWLAGTRRPAVALALLTAVLPVTVFMGYPGWRVAGHPAAADHGVAAVREAGLAPDEVYILLRWHLMERVGLRQPPMQDYLFSETIEPALLDRARMVLTIFPEHVEPLRALGWEVREARGAPEGFSGADLRAAILSRDIAGLRARFGEPLFIATRPAG